MREQGNQNASPTKGCGCQILRQSLGQFWRFNTDMRTDPSSVESTLLSSLKLSTCAFTRQGEEISRSCVAASIPNPLLLKILGFSFSAIGHLQALGIAEPSV